MRQKFTETSQVSVKLFAFDFYDPNLKKRFFSKIKKKTKNFMIYYIPGLNDQNFNIRTHEFSKFKFQNSWVVKILNFGIHEQKNLALNYM